MIIKRLFDIFGAFAGLLIFAPVILATAISIRITMGAPVLFRQTRPGLSGEPFLMLKFRTMRKNDTSAPASESDAQRLTQLGQFLRATSLDELPELWNVLKGDMTLVGPRPLLMEYLPLYSAEQARRHEVRPGLTGWAQVNGRNSISWDEKFEFDIWYVNNRSLLLDIKVLWLTVVGVIRRDGISAEGEATMPVFEGSDK